MAISALVSAFNFTLESPSEVSIDEQFTANILFDSSETYDVKITIIDKSNSQLSQIYNDGWKSPFYYIKEAFPDRKSFEIKAIKYSEDSKICCRLRKPEKTTYSEVCNPIKLIQNAKNTEEVSEKEAKTTQKNSTKETISEKVNQTTSAQKSNSNNGSFIPLSNTQVQENNKIILSPNSNKQGTIFTTKQEKFRLGIVYAFTILCVILIILLALRKL